MGEGAHNDLALALSFAVWEADKGLFGIDVDDSLVVSTIRPFSVSAEDLYSLDDPYYRW